MQPPQALVACDGRLQFFHETRSFSLMFLESLKMPFDKFQLGCQMSFFLEWLLSSHFTLKAWLMKCHRHGHPSSRYLFRGPMNLTLTDHWVRLPTLWRAEVLPNFFNFIIIEAGVLQVLEMAFLKLSDWALLGLHGVFFFTDSKFGFWDLCFRRDVCSKLSRFSRSTLFTNHYIILYFT